MRFQELQGCAVLGAIVGGDEVEERKRSSRETVARAVDGMRRVGYNICCTY